MRYWRAVIAVSFCGDYREHASDRGHRRRQRRAGRHRLCCFSSARARCFRGVRAGRLALEAIGAIGVVRILDARRDSRLAPRDRLDDGRERSGVVADEFGPGRALSPETSGATRGAGRTRTLAEARDRTCARKSRPRGNAIMSGCRPASRCCARCSKRRLTTSRLTVLPTDVLSRSTTRTQVAGYTRDDVLRLERDRA